MPAPQIDITYLIVNYASRHHLSALITEIERVTRHTYEIIIINNDTEPLSLTARTESDVHIINVGDNIGFGRAHNRGARDARGRYLCILNPDLHDLSPHFSDCIDLFADSHVGIVAPEIQDQEGHVQRWSYDHRELTPLRLIWDNLHPGPPTQIETTPETTLAWVTGAALFIPRHIFHAIDGFDERFFLYYEDIDLCRRVRAAGYDVRRTQKHSVTHISGASSASAHTQKEAYFTSQDYYFHKHHGQKSMRMIQILRHAFHRQHTPESIT